MGVSYMPTGGRARLRGDRRSPRRCLDHFITGNHRLLRSRSRPAGACVKASRALFRLRGGRGVEAGGRVGASSSDVNRDLVWPHGPFGDGTTSRININLTAFCNLECSYCFADGGDFGRIKGLDGEARRSTTSSTFIAPARHRLAAPSGSSSSAASRC